MYQVVSERAWIVSTKTNQDHVHYVAVPREILALPVLPVFSTKCRGAFRSK